MPCDEFMTERKFSRVYAIPLPLSLSPIHAASKGQHRASPKGRRDGLRPTSYVSCRIDTLRNRNILPIARHDITGSLGSCIPSLPQVVTTCRNESIGLRTHISAHNSHA